MLNLYMWKNLLYFNMDLTTSNWKKNQKKKKIEGTKWKTGVYLLTQAGIFSFQKSNTVNVTGQTVIEILQLNFLCNSTVASWTAITQQIDWNHHEILKYTFQ